MKKKCSICNSSELQKIKKHIICISCGYIFSSTFFEKVINSLKKAIIIEKEHLKHNSYMEELQKLKTSENYAKILAKIESEKEL